MEKRNQKETSHRALHLISNVHLGSWLCYSHKPTQPENIIGYSLLLRVRPRFFDQVGHEILYASSGNKHFFTKSCHRQTYQNYEQPARTSQNLYFQSHFSALKIGWIFPKNIFYEEYSTRRPTFIKKCFWKFWFLTYFIF